MSDIAINRNLDVFIDQSGDLAFAEGRDAFEQDITLHLVDFYHDVIGEEDPDTVLKLLEVGARRAVDDIGLLDRLATIEARFSDTKPNTVKVDIIFDTGEALEFEATGAPAEEEEPGRVFDEGVFEATTSFDIYDDGILK